MLNSLIERITKELLSLKSNIDKVEYSNNINSIINKILKNEPITEEELELFKDIKSHVTDLSEIEQETLLFIEFIIEGEYTLEKIQIDLLKKLLTKFKLINMSSEISKYEKDKRLLEALQSDNIFSEFDLLNSKLTIYGYNNKDILTIIRGLILSNYGSISKDKIGIEEQEEIVETTEEVVEDEAYVERKNKIIAIFRKYKFHTKDYEDKAFIKLFESDKDIDEITYVLNFLKELKEKPSTMFMKNPGRFIYIIMHTTKESIEEFKVLCNKVGVKPQQMFKISQAAMIYSESYLENSDNPVASYLESFKLNIEFFDSIGFNYEICEDIFIYLINPKYISTAYNLYLNVYNCTLNNPNDIEYLCTFYYANSLDRTIELDMGETLIKKIDSLGLCSKKLFYFGKRMEIMHKKEFISLDDYIFKTKAKTTTDDFAFIDNEVEIPVLDDPEDMSELYSLFNSSEDNEGEIFYFIPHDQSINDEIYNNEYVVFLDKTYKRNNILYIINNTRVSRIKVLRILSYFMENDIEINSASVKFALKFDLIAFQQDIDNLNKSLDKFIKGGSSGYVKK